MFLNPCVGLANLPSHGVKQYHECAVSKNGVIYFFCVVVRRHGSKFRLNCAVLVTILKIGTHRETLRENNFSYRTTLPDMLFPWKLHFNELHVKSHSLHILLEIWICRRIEMARSGHSEMKNGIKCCRHGNHILIYAHILNYAIYTGFSHSDQENDNHCTLFIL